MKKGWSTDIEIWVWPHCSIRRHWQGGWGGWWQGGWQGGWQVGWQGGWGVGWQGGWQQDSDHIAASEDDDKEDEEGGNLLLSLLPRSLLLIISDLSRFLSLPADYSLHSADILKMASLWDLHCAVELEVEADKETEGNQRHHQEVRHQDVVPLISGSNTFNIRMYYLQYQNIIPLIKHCKHYTAVL